MRTLVLVSAMVAAGAVGCGPSDNSNTNNTNRNTNQNTNSTQCTGDADNDGICDEYEGRASDRDTDGDHTPDYLDLDSDNDGIPDSIEWGGVNPGDPPRDSNGDGIPDFVQTDSDGNGFPDGVDGTGDVDGDGIPNFADMDDDGDGILDTIEMERAPQGTLDTDGDGIPDYQDTDSDNDTILDLHEGNRDSDNDGIPDYLDLDSDNDGIPDSVEAGDSDPNTAPVNSDEDVYADFRDSDSDNDGLPDGLEDLNANGVVDPGESNPKVADTDGDGVTDLIEMAAGTDPQDPTDNPQSHGNFYFVVPYEEPTAPLQDTLKFRTSVQFADLYFSFDETGSMIEEFGVLSAATGVPALINGLKCADTGVPCIKDSDCAADEVCFAGTETCIQNPLIGAGCVPDLWTGVGMWSDCSTYHNALHLQPDPVATANLIHTDYPGYAESVLQSAACVANPAYCANNPGCSAHPSVVGPVGCPGFRPEAVRILIQITDADNQAGASCGGSAGNVSSATVAGNALSSLGIKFVGLYGTDDDGSGAPCGTPLECANQLGTASGTVDGNGNPIVFPIGNDGTTLVATTRQAVLALVRGVPLNVVIQATDLPDDDGDALAFIDYLEVNVSGGDCTAVNPTADTNGDGRQDAFPSLLGGTPVCWDVHPILTNDFRPATEVPQVFKARLTVFGDGSPLDSRDVFFLIPPVITGPGGPG